MAKKTITVEGNTISILAAKGQEDYISLTDLAKKFNNENPSALIINWMRNKDTIEFLGVWEKLNNNAFNLIEFDKVKSEAGTNRFVISVGKWVASTQATGITAKAGRHDSGTFAHRDIALAFCYWLSPPFQLYVIKEFQRLKTEEAEKNKSALEWDIRRILTKINYRVHTDAVKTYLIPPKLLDTGADNLYYATEADILNLGLFGMTAKQWKEKNPTLKGNLRDDATTEQLLVLSNLENINAEFIKSGLDKQQRLRRLNEIAIHQMSLFTDLSILKKLKGNNNSAEE